MAGRRTSNEVLIASKHAVIVKAYYESGGHLTQTARKLGMQRKVLQGLVDSDEVLAALLEEVEHEWYDDIKLSLRKAALDPKSAAPMKKAYLENFGMEFGRVSGPVALTPKEHLEAMKSINKRAARLPLPPKAFRDTNDEK